LANTLEQRFWEKVDRTSTPDGCWLWKAAIDSSGYGAVKHMGKKRNSHRIAYELAHGPIERNLDIMHSCDVRLCCNPAHLSAGTRLQNVQDAQIKNRMSKGETHGSAKLSDPLVRAIKVLHAEGKSGYWIHRELGLCKKTVGDIINGTNWKHITIDSQPANEIHS